MQVGLFHSIQWPEGSNQQDRYDQALTQACHADEAGFDSVWLTEHHFSRHGIVSDSLMVLAHLAARTSSVRLGTAVSVLPLHHPVRLAEAAATVDQLSGGRLDLGIGRGYQPGSSEGSAWTSPRSTTASPRPSTCSSGSGPPRARCRTRGPTGRSRTPIPSPARSSGRTHRCGWRPTAPTGWPCARRRTACSSPRAPR